MITSLEEENIFNYYHNDVSDNWGDSTSYLCSSSNEDSDPSDLASSGRLGFDIGSSESEQET